MFKSIFNRNVALLIGVVFAGQLLAGLMVQLTVLGPQTRRIADVSADMVQALSVAMAGLPPEQQRAMVDRLSKEGHVLVRPLSDPPDSGARFPSFLEFRFMRAMADKLATQDTLEWRTDSSKRLWLRLAMGDADYWVSLTPPRVRSAMSGMLIALLTAFVIASVAGLFLQRWLDMPLRRLADAVDRYDPDQPAPLLETGGPAEVAGVAGAFNRMTARITQQEADRALMLGGVSHDLRTPLTRLRLSLEMIGGDPEIRALAERQVDRIGAMLTQFLDFARGFEGEPEQLTDIPALLRQLAEDEGAEAAVQVAADADLLLMTRPHALARAVANLLGNAVRHGAPPIALSARREGGRVLIGVRDGGAGIAAEDLEALIRPFARGNAARSGDGTGLGLAIATRAISAIGGRLDLARTADGFEAIVELPDR